MALPPNIRFGPYTLAGSIGAGGMGEVYRATDTNLKREVAIKVLPESFAQDADRLARFQREAEVLASLNHVNIATIHGLERSENITALVMELVEGPTLAERLEQGPIPVDEALSIEDNKVQISNAGGMKPLWSRDGSELFYLQPGSGTPSLMAVSVQTDGASFAFGSRTTLFDWPYHESDQGRNYDVSLDGQQFLAIKPVGSTDPEGSSRQIVITLNWVEELKRLVPN
jgi:hypothetical protein